MVERIGRENSPQRRRAARRGGAEEILCTGSRAILSLLACALLSSGAPAASLWPQTAPLPQQEAQQQPERQPPQGALKMRATAQQKASPALRLRVTRGTPTLITLRAEAVPLAEVAARLERQLGVPVRLSPLMRKQRVTLEFDSLPLDNALQLLAPQAFVEEEISGGASAPAQLVSVSLAATNEEAPAPTSAVRREIQAIVVEGDTEEGPRAGATPDRDAAQPLRVSEEEQALRVSYEEHRLSVHARRQPLAVVLAKIAERVGIPFDMRHETGEIVDVDFSDATLEQAMGNLPAAARLYVRRRVQTSESEPLRLVLAEAVGQSTATVNR